MATRRIFISSTAEDLADHRQAVADALLRMENLPIAMESFGARPGSSVEVCKGGVRESDAVIVLVAHRYGWVPPESDGGDGRRSITWVEVDEAIARDKPVFAFLVDPDFKEWTGKREEERIKEALDDPDRQQRVIENLRQLEALKKMLGKRVREVFTTPEDLAAKVIASVAAWLQEEARRPARASTTPAPPPRLLRVVHPLQPAQHFSGRKALLTELRVWWRDRASPDRVFALVAHGGAGKTAVAEQLLRTIRADANAGSLRGSVLVWSFYEDPKTEAFLEAAEELFCGSSEGGAGGRLQRLERALSAGAPHLLVLDGLERVQGEGGPGRARGELQDAQTRNLLRSIAAGLGRARALITSRFKLPDLQDWTGSGFRAEELDDLDRMAAVGLLQAYGVRGEEQDLAHLAESAGRHALTLSVMGSFLRDFHDGDPTAVPSLDLDDAAEDDPKAAKLHRLLQTYATQLPDQERDLLVRLSTFPRGVSAEILGHLIDAGGEIAGTLVGCGEPRLVRLAERLVSRGLVFAYESDGLRAWTAHPFLRDWFRELLGVASEQVHEAVRLRLAPSLEARPSEHPTDQAVLDRYEALIEHSLLAARVEEAWGLFWHGLGGYEHLGNIGEYVRGLRIVQSFAEDRDPTRLRSGVHGKAQGQVLSEWGLFASVLGELHLAECVSDMELPLWKERGNASSTSISLQNAADLALLLGQFPRARWLSEEAISFAQEAKAHTERRDSHAYLAAVFHALGENEQSVYHLERATELEGERMYSLRGIQEAEHLLDIGKLDEAQAHATANLATCEPHGWRADTARCHSLLALCALPEHPATARDHVAEVRRFVETSGHMECGLRAHHAAAEIARVTGDYGGALGEAEAGLRLAERCGFGGFAINFGISLARTHLHRADPRRALRHARAALDASTHEECQYAWGEANAAHLCALAHRALDEPELVERRARQALAVRERIGHPEVEETRQLLADG